MKSLIFVLVAATLPGCTTYSVAKSCKDQGQCVSYAQVSEGNGSGMHAALTGEGNTCKVTTFGDPKGWSVQYEGEKCNAQFEGETSDRETAE